MSNLRRAVWLSLVTAVAVIACLLGRWQLHRLAARRRANAVLIAARARVPVDLPRDLALPGAIDSGRRIVAHGQFDVSRQIFLRGREQDDAPGLDVVTPFRLDSSAAVIWVIRGFVRSPDATTLPDSVPLPRDGSLTITGLATAVASTPDSGRPLRPGPAVTWQRLDRQALHQLIPASLDVALLLADDSLHLGGLPVVAPPELGNGPHLSYAIQWFGIALAVVVFGIMVIWRGGRASPRRPGAP